MTDATTTAEPQTAEAPAPATVPMNPTTEKPPRKPTTPKPKASKPKAAKGTGKKPTKKAATKKAAGKPKATKGTKKASGKPKASTKATGKARVKDDARLVSKASEGYVSASQVRILRALKGTKQGSKEFTRGDLKEKVGIGRDGKYSAGWLKDLWDLDAHKLISIHERENSGKGPAIHTHVITAKGKADLERFEKKAADTTKAEAAEAAAKAKAKAGKAA